MTVLSFGAGQDSTAILLEIIFNPDFKSKYVHGHLVVVFSDTGNEHDYTYAHAEKMKDLCIQHGIPFFFLTNDMGFHTGAWPDLITPQMRGHGEPYKPTMVQIGTKSCTDKLKLVPIYKFLDEYINDLYGYEFNVHKNRGCLKKAIKRFYKEEGRISVLIGFAFREESRMEKSEKLQAKHLSCEGDIWEKALLRKYPLIPEKMDREKCQEVITQYLGYCPMPSNCMLCPYQSDVEILWLHRHHPDQFYKWVTIEARKLSRYKDEEKNYGVYCTSNTLLDKLKKAKDKYGYFSNEQLSNHKMNHGCCTNGI